MYLIQKLKYNLRLQNDVLKRAKKSRSIDNLFTTKEITCISD